MLTTIAIFVTCFSEKINHFSPRFPFIEKRFLKLFQYGTANLIEITNNTFFLIIHSVCQSSVNSPVGIIPPKFGDGGPVPDKLVSHSLFSSS